MNNKNNQRKNIAYMPSQLGKYIVPIAVINLLLNAASADILPNRQQSLMYLLKQDCGSCHGMTMKGGLGPALTPDALKGKPRALMVNAILYGRPGTPMPPWKGMLSEEEAAWMVDELYHGITNE
jgi:cytochrome c55X